MADLISRAAVLARFKALQEYDPEHERRGWACNFLNNSREPSTEWYCVEDVVENVPAVDAVPVVRCADCKYSDTFPEGSETTMPMKCLDIRYGGVMPDWYCEHGERRNSE